MKEAEVTTVLSLLGSDSLELEDSALRVGDSGLDTVVVEEGELLEDCRVLAVKETKLRLGGEDTILLELSLHSLLALKSEARQ